MSAATPRGRDGASSSAVRSAMAANDPEAACAAVRLEIRSLLAAICAGLPPAGASGATWAELGDDCAVRGLLREAARIVAGE